MTAQLLTDLLLLDPEAPAPCAGSLLLEDGRIRAALPKGSPLPAGLAQRSLGSRRVAPGFIDLHVHGDLLFREAGEVGEALQVGAKAMLAHGVTSYLPTTVAWPRAELASRVEELAAGIAACDVHAAAVPLGLHLEGPWINTARAGAQPPAGIRPYAAAEGTELFARAAGLVRMVTLAPELVGAAALLEELGRRGIVAALGHTAATPAEVDRAVAAGATHVTHIYNAMGAASHREPGFLGHVLVEDRLTCDLICDGAHVHPDMMRLAARAKGDRLMLITDRIEPPEGGQSFGAGAAHRDGRAIRLADGRLAGSCVTLDLACRNARELIGWSWSESIAACTLRPALALGIASERGTFRPGARADLVVLDDEGGVEETWLAGQVAWARSAVLPRA